MTGLNGVTVESPDQVAADEAQDEGARCLACVHLWSEHGPLDVRFCTATLAKHHDRGCICTPGR
ncbi:RGCVC family protein [Pseudonocardia pini]|uniref:RGCVC family protein n=1 Tax=Pseudonocardia pini TaxID=2758030 RepID=UPI0015F02DD1|nr:RGCVC family protein [Pseudonocardia pini]